MGHRFGSRGGFAGRPEWGNGSSWLVLAIAVGSAACSARSAAGAGTGRDAAASDANGDARTPSPDADAAADASRADAAPLDGSTPPLPDAVAPSGDATPDAGGGEGGALAALSSCLGIEQTLTISSQMPYVDVPVGSEAGEFVLDFASTFSSIDMKAFTTPPATTNCDPTMLWQVCSVAGFAFFGAPGTVTLTTEDFSDIQGTVRQAGIIGTDFLSEGVFTLAYGAGKAFDATSSQFCGDALLKQEGFFPLSTAGFFENDLTMLMEFTNVDSGGQANTTVPNVPTVPVQIAGVSAVAQLDTGFDDGSTPFSVNINEAFLTAINAANPNALVRDSSLDETLTTCVSGVSEPVYGYRPAAGVSLGFVDTSGNVARSYPNAAIFVKDTPAAAQSCGGIGIWTVPAAQVAASYYVDMGILVFDPYHATVWIPGR